MRVNGNRTVVSRPAHGARRWMSGALSLTLASCVAAQTLPARWRWSNPAPHGANIFDMAYGRGLTVQVGERGQLFVSEDLKFWQPKTTGTTRSLRAVAFFGDRLVVTGEAGTVLYADSLEDIRTVDLGTTDWLEALASSGTTLVAVGDNAAIYTSADGASWTRETPPSNATNWLRGVAFGNGTFVAVGENGFIATANSTGKSWTKKNAGTTAHLNRAAFIDGKFWVAGDNGLALTSNNGNSWSQISGTGATRSLFAVTGTNSMKLLLGDRELRLTQDGTTWTDELSLVKALPAVPWQYYASVWEGSLFVVAGRSGMIFEGFTTNGTDYLWVNRHDSSRAWLWDMLRTPNFYVAVGDYGTILTSSRGVTWDLELTPDAATNSVLLGIAGTTNGLVAVGSKGAILHSPNTLREVVFTNTDNSRVTNTVSTVGTVWQSVVSPVNSDLRGAAFSDGLFVVAGAGGVILTSTNGANWHVQTSPVSVFLSGATAFPGGFVLTGDQGTILTSPNGTNWTARSSGTTNWLSRVRFLNGLLVAVGDNGAILTSADGVTWTSRSSGTIKWLNDVGCEAGTYFAVGNQGTVLASADTVTWTNVGTLTQKSLFGVASHQGQLVVAGLEGVILRAQLSPLMERVRFLEFGSAGGEQAFLLSAVPDLRFEIQSSTNLVDWIAGQTLEVIDPSGTILFRQKAGTDSLATEFFRAVTKP